MEADRAGRRRSSTITRPSASAIGTRSGPRGRIVRRIVSSAASTGSNGGLTSPMVAPRLPRDERRRILASDHSLARVHDQKTFKQGQ